METEQYRQPERVRYGANMARAAALRLDRSDYEYRLAESIREKAAEVEDPFASLMLYEEARQRRKGSERLAVTPELALLKGQARATATNYAATVERNAESQVLNEACAALEMAAKEGPVAEPRTLVERLNPVA